MCVNKAKNLTIIITTKTIIPYRWEKSARLSLLLHHDDNYFRGRPERGLQHVQHTKRDKTHTSPIDIIIKPPGISLLHVKRRRLINWIIVSFHSPLHVRPTTLDVDYKQKKLSFSGVGGWLRWHSKLIIILVRRGLSARVAASYHPPPPSLVKCMLACCFAVYDRRKSALRLDWCAVCSLSRSLPRLIPMQFHFQSFLYSYRNFFFFFVL